MLTRTLSRALLLSTLAATAAAQTPTTKAAQTQPGADDAVLNKAIEQRIATLQTKLAITTGQLADWTAFATAMRDNANSTNALFSQRAQNAAAMSAVDNMKSYAALARGYADNMEKLADAFAKLYAGLTPEQQKNADTVFREKPATTRVKHR